MTVTIDGSASVTINSGAILGINSSTAVASTSGTSIDFTSIPSYVKRITVMFNGVSTSGTSQTLIRLGTSSGSVATGYLGAGGYLNPSLAATQNNTGFITDALASSGNIRHSIYTIVNITGNIWVISGCGAISDSAIVSLAGGSLTLSATLDRVRITTVNGTDTFDAGTINILYE